MQARIFRSILLLLPVIFLGACNAPVRAVPPNAPTHEVHMPDADAPPSVHETTAPAEDEAAAIAPLEPVDPIHGRLANPGLENERIRTSLFFPGQARDGSVRYGCQTAENLGLFTIHPADERHLQWSESDSIQAWTLNEMLAAGLNTVSMSSWGEDFLPCSTGWNLYAPMQSAPGAHDELFAAAIETGMVIIPFLESRPDWSLRNEFPTDANGDVAPGLVSQAVNLIERYLLNAEHPEWADAWAQVFNSQGEPRYAFTLIHVSSERLAAGRHADFAAGFDRVAEEIHAQTGVWVAFFLDALPGATHAPGTYFLSPEGAGPYLLASESVLGIQAFIPEIWLPAGYSDAGRLAWKAEYCRRWAGSGVPFLMDIAPGYDAHIVFPGSVVYGHTEAWRVMLLEMVDAYSADGLAFNSWNGYTEAMAGVATVEYGVIEQEWLRAACELTGALSP